MAICSVQSFLFHPLRPPTIGAVRAFGVNGYEQMYCIMPVIQCIACQLSPGGLLGNLHLNATHYILLPGLLPKGAYVRRRNSVCVTDWWGTAVTHRSFNSSGIGLRNLFSFRSVGEWTFSNNVVGSTSTLRLCIAAVAWTDRLVRLGGSSLAGQISRDQE